MDYIKMRVDNGDAITIEWETLEEGTNFTDFMERIEIAVVAAGYSQVLVDKYMRGE